MKRKYRWTNEDKYTYYTREVIEWLFVRFFKSICAHQYSAQIKKLFEKFVLLKKQAVTMIRQSLKQLSEACLIMKILAEFLKINMYRMIMDIRKHKLRKAGRWKENVDEKKETVGAHININSWIMKRNYGRSYPIILFWLKTKRITIDCLDHNQKELVI